MIVIELKFDKSQNRLAGFPYGETVYKEQAKNIIDKNNFLKDKVEVVFPEQIEKVASSFIQGFFAELINSIGYSEIERCFEIKASNDELSKKITENIY